HAHPASQQILGVLDTSLSLAKADEQLAAGSYRMLAYTIFAVFTIAVLSWVFVWRVVGQPIKALKSGTERLTAGDLGYQLEVQSQDEVGDLAHSFNIMSLQLRAANEEIVAWAKTLEERVAQKTRELKRASDHMLHVEKMASIGKMAAVVAHEINIPLVQCDPAQIEQVILALVMNAIDAMARGGNLWLRTRMANADSVEMEVRDDGSGIPPEILSQIFEPFLTTKETGRGVGLGLAISRGIIERHNGTIEVQSESGRGTT